MRRISWSVVVIGLSLSGCSPFYSNGNGLVAGGAADAAWAADYFKGKPLDDAISCIGNPASERRLENGKQETQWNAVVSPTNLGAPINPIGNIPGLAYAADIPASAFTGSISTQLGGGNGHLMIISHNEATDKAPRHIIDTVNMSGSGDGLSGRNGLIGVELLRGCRRGVDMLQQSRPQ